jgi:hypothetical protein
LRNTERRRITAIHEAGHIIMCRHIDTPVMFAYANEWNGITVPDLAAGMTWTGAENRLVTLASLAAERIAYPDRDPLAHVGTGNDFSQASDSLRQDGSDIDDIHAAVLAIADEAEVILRARWDEVEREAAYLLTRVRLRYRIGKIRHLIRYDRPRVITKVRWAGMEVCVGFLVLRSLGWL